MKTSLCVLALAASLAAPAYAAPSIDGAIVQSAPLPEHSNPPAWRRFDDVGPVVQGAQLPEENGRKAMTPTPLDPSILAFAHAFGELCRNPWALAYLAGVATGWTLARRSIRYMMGGRP